MPAKVNATLHSPVIGGVAANVPVILLSLPGVAAKVFVLISAPLLAQW